MKRRHLPPALVLVLLSLLSLSLRRRTPLQPPPPPPPPIHAAKPAAGDPLLRRLAAAESAGYSQLLADATALFANGSISTFPSLGGRYRLLYLRLPQTPGGPPRPRTISRARVPAGALPSDGSLLAAFRASLRSFLLSHRRLRRAGAGNVAAVMTDLPFTSALLGPRTTKAPTCAVVGNSGVLLGSGRGAQIDAHGLVIRLNNARIAGFGPDVGARTSLSFANSNILHLCASHAAATAPGCGCHPYGAAVPMAMYVCQPAHLLDALICNATAGANPFRLILTDPRLDALAARIAKYYSLRRFVTSSSSSAAAAAGGWAKKHDERYFHYSSGLQAVVMALGLCEEVSLFGFGKPPGAKHHYHTNQKKELDLHDYEAEYEFYGDLQDRPETVPFLDEAHGFTVPPVRLYW